MYSSELALLLLNEILILMAGLRIPTKEIETNKVLVPFALRRLVELLIFHSQSASLWDPTGSEG